LAAAAPVVSAAVAVTAALTMAAAVPAEGAAVAKAAVEGPDTEALFLSLSQASLLSLLYCCPLSTHCRYTPSRRVDAAGLAAGLVCGGWTVMLTNTPPLTPI
jgi:hypothetical protein